MDKLRVWWIPQAGAIEEAFYVPVETVEEGKKVMDMLAAYDAYQRQNRIKPIIVIAVEFRDGMKTLRTGKIGIWKQKMTTLMMWMITVNSVKRQRNLKSLTVKCFYRLIGKRLNECHKKQEFPSE